MSSKKGSKKFSWWADFQVGGKRYRKRSVVNSKIGADELEATLRQRISRGEVIDAGPTTEKDLTFGDYVPHWFKTYVVAHNKLSEKKSKSDILRVHLLPWFGKMKMGEIDVSSIDAYKASRIQLGLKEKTINNQLTVLRTCLRSAEERKLIPCAPWIRQLKAQPPSFDFLTSSESSQLLQDHAEPTWNEMVLFGLRTGMRLGELLAVEWRDVDLERGMVSVRRSSVYGVVGSTKSKRERHIRLSNSICEMLLQRSKRDGLLFKKENGQPLDKYIARNAIHRICKRVGLRLIGFHVLRHSFASQLAMEGIPIPVIKDLLGHTSITTTMRYAHLSPSTLEDSISVLELAEQRELRKKCQPAVNQFLVPGVFSGEIEDDMNSFRAFIQTKNTPRVVM